MEAFSLDQRQQSAETSVDLLNLGSNLELLPPLKGNSSAVSIAFESIVASLVQTSATSELIANAVAKLELRSIAAHDVAEVGNERVPFCSQPFVIIALVSDPAVGLNTVPAQVLQPPRESGHARRLLHLLI